MAWHADIILRTRLSPFRVVGEPKSSHSRVLVESYVESWSSRKGVAGETWSSRSRVRVELKSSLHQHHHNHNHDHMEPSKGGPTTCSNGKRSSEFAISSKKDLARTETEPPSQGTSGNPRLVDNTNRPCVPALRLNLPRQTRPHQPAVPPSRRR